MAFLASKVEYSHCRDTYEEVARSANYLKLKTEYRPLIGIICGSGLGQLCDILQQADVFPYSEIPGFAISTGKVCLLQQTRQDD